MPVPKRKTSKRRRDQRSSTRFIRVKAIAKCSNCEHPLPPHSACTQCGFYKGKKVIATKLDRVLKRGELKKAHQANQHMQEYAQENNEKDNK